jgi:hypothetical protein
MGSSESDFQTLLDESITAGKKLTGIEGPPRLIYSTGVFTKQLLTSYTLWRVMHPAPTLGLDSLKDGQIIHDFPSAFVLIRSLYETMLQAYNTVLSKDYSQARNVVMSVARLHSLRERLTLANNMNSKHEVVLQMREEIGPLRERIFVHDEFEHLPKAVRRYVKEPQVTNRSWHSKSVSTLAEEAGIHATWHLQYYNYLSNYTHADPMSIEQVEAVRSPAEPANLIDIAYDFGCNFLGRSLRYHSIVCTEEGHEAAISDESSAVIDFWVKLNTHEMSRPIL